MTRSPPTFKGTDLKRAINSAKEAGLQVSRFEITKGGSIIVHVDDVADDTANDDNEWDKALGG